MTQPYSGAPPKTRPGQMTAVMRALPQASGPKVLRIGLVQGGRVIEERVIKQRTHVTIGPNEKCMFVLAAPNIPSTFRLFELVGADYHLNFVDGMTGRVALQTGISDLDGLRGQAKRAGQAYQVRLTEDARGKVVVGDITFLFQFVAPPPIQPKPQLPVSVQSGLSSQIDWRFTIIAAFSFLFHFGAVGMLYSDWMDPKIDDEVSIAGLLDTVKSLPPPPAVVETPTDTTKVDNSATATDNTPKAGGGGPKAGAAGAGAGKGGGKGSLSSSERAALSNELDQLEVATLGALNSSGTATAGVLRSGDVPGGALELAAASGAGVGSSGGSGLNLGGGGGGIVRPGAGVGGGGLASIGNTGGAAPATAGSASKAPAGPKGNASASAGVSGGAIPNASRVVSGMSAGFRACYNRGLQSNPEMSGSVKVTARIGPNGEVQSATASPSGSISGDVANCIASRVRSAQFDPPQGGAATVSIPVTLVTQKQ